MIFTFRPKRSILGVGQKETKMLHYIIKKLPPKLILNIIFNMSNHQISQLKFHLPPNQISLDLINLLYQINNPPTDL